MVCPNLFDVRKISFLFGVPYQRMHDRRVVLYRYQVLRLINHMVVQTDGYINY
jgi:hypothetical protein